jgi:cellulose 1,4-beta-cellobiosidase
MAACSRPTNVQQRWAQPARPEQAVAVAALPVEAATVSPSPNVNPFVDGAFYADPGYGQKVRASAERSAHLATKMARVEKQPTALWLDRIVAIAQLPEWLASAREQSRTLGKPTVPVVVVYNLPNRDCSAKASNGELAIEQGGERRYREEYIDVIANHLAADPEQRVAIVLEPDSLPNLISNLGVEKCAISEQVYKHSVAYAISRLSLPNVYIYLDVAHAGWLGWETNQRRMVELIAEVLRMAGGTSRIRGFASNVSNYNALHE